MEGLATPLLAKLDTGADRSSVDARRIEEIVRNGRSMLSFRIGGDTGPQLERERRNQVRVRRAAAAADQRDTVVLILTIADRAYPVEVSLADRTGLDYPLLIGRDILAGRYVVSSAKIQTTEVNCQE